MQQFDIRIWGKLHNFAFIRISVAINLRYQNINLQSLSFKKALM